MDYFKFRQNSTIYTDLTVIQHLQCQYQPFVSYLLAEDPGPSIPNIELYPTWNYILQNIHTRCPIGSFKSSLRKLCMVCPINDIEFLNWT